MSTVKELIRVESNGSISFGDYELDSKAKLSDFEHDGDIYKVKTFREITKLERNGTLAYESVPGTAVFDMKIQSEGVEFCVSGKEDAQITIEMEADTEYNVCINENKVGSIKTNLGGKLSFSVDLENEDKVAVKISRA